jgi:hypothetical protein
MNQLVMALTASVRVTRVLALALVFHVLVPVQVEEADKGEFF